MIWQLIPIFEYPGWKEKLFWYWCLCAFCSVYLR